MRISEKADIQGLAINIILGAVDELFMGDRYPRSKKPAIVAAKRVKAQLKAWEFLVSKDFQFWADVAGRDLDVTELMRRAKHARKVLETTPKRRYYDR